MKIRIRISRRFSSRQARASLVGPSGVATQNECVNRKWMKRIRRIIADEAKKDQILILVRGVSGRELAHTIDAPVSLLFHEKDEGAPQGLDIDSEDGKTTVLRFSSVARPEMLDGVLSEVQIIPELIPAEA